MPQMAPMSWVTLLLFFTMSMIMGMSMLYFLYLPFKKLSNKKSPPKSKSFVPPMNKKSSNSKKIGWKW
nr:ATP synthase F0 subunit 8 [Syrista sp. 1 GYN-2021c]